MSPRDHLLSSKDMARFVAQGFLRFDELIPKDLCTETIKLFDRNAIQRVKYDRRPLYACWPGLALREVFALPRVRGIVESLVGPEPQHDHYAIHTVAPQTKRGPNLHQDAEYDVRFEHFDVQVSIFFHDTPREMGGTLFVPGSHFRRVHESQITRYHNIVGQVPTVCKAGTFVVWHHNLWHASRSNRTDAMRYMFKVRINPTVKQLRLWDTADLNDPEIEKILGQSQPWYGQEGRLETMNRIRLWRALTGNPSFDIHTWLGRIENRPERIAEETLAAV